MVDRVPHNPDDLAAFCERNHVAKLAFFGSVLRDDFNEASDIDMLVEFQPGARITYFDLATMEIELAKILNTERRIDLRTPKELSRYFQDEVRRKAKVVYTSSRTQPYEEHSSR